MTLKFRITTVIQKSENKIDLYYVMVMTPSKGNKDRYVFDGEAPFGINVMQVY